MDSILDFQKSLTVFSLWTVISFRICDLALLSPLYFKDVVQSLHSGKPSGLRCVHFPALAATVPQASTPKT